MLKQLIRCYVHENPPINFQKLEFSNKNKNLHSAIFKKKPAVKLKKNNNINSLTICRIFKRYFTIEITFAFTFKQIKKDGLEINGK